MPEKSALTPEDIRLLMGNYQNIIQMNTILLEQQKQLLELQRQVITKQDSIVTSQAQTCTQLKDVAAKLDLCASNLQKTNISIQDSCSRLGEHIDSQLKNNDDKIDSWKVDVVKQHSSINRNIYVAWGAMASIVLGLIAMVITSYEKYSVIDKMYHILKDLAQYFRVG